MFFPFFLTHLVLTCLAVPRVLLMLQEGNTRAVSRYLSRFSEWDRSYLFPGEEIKIKVCSV